MSQFTLEAIAAAQAAQRKWGCPASVTLAQYLIESSCGKYEPPGSNNPFGIKARPGEPYVNAMTTEYVNGVPRRVEQPFRKFASLAEAFQAHAFLFVNVSLYHEALAHASDPDAFVRLMAPHYATAPTYAADLIRAMKADNLYQYDVATSPPAATETAPDGAETDAWSKWLQTWCNAHGASPALYVDGDFGRLSRNALSAILTKLPA